MEEVDKPKEKRGGGEGKGIKVDVPNPVICFLWTPI